ncbi:MAG: chemotaxis protein CheW [candidate division WOR-3 bacterium]|nr:MAG: chemotaxis protein CheW [candidate division WOR-3 bacterium]
MESYRELFISETEEYIKQLNKHLLNLETNYLDTRSILEVFRIFHTVKGMSQTMGYGSIGKICHRVEELLDEAKERGEINPTVVNFLFRVADYLAKSVYAIRHKKRLPASRKIISVIRKMEEGRDVEFKREKRVREEISEIRVKMRKLDKLFNLTNELMVARSRFLRLSRQIGDTALVSSTETASRLISGLHDEVMRLRMLPLSTVFDFFPRWFRDEAKRQRKQVDLEIVGAEIEVDRSIIDVLREPLLHLIRNALDHGIKQESDRGKKEKSKVTLKAEREKERIKISVCDNGAGIDIERVRRIAIERNIMTETAIQHLTHEELLRLLTDPHFSTKENVSAISGRGIGLDIVNSTAVKLGGKLEIATEVDKGSCFILDLPVSLAVVRAMIFTVDSQRFAIPLNYVQETFYTKESMFKTVYHRELFPLRDEILPLVKLGDRLGCVRKEGRKSIIVVQYEGKRRGFVIDDILDEEEIVIKKLDNLVSEPIYSGCSVYADGLPILIIDPRGFE